MELNLSITELQLIFNLLEAESFSNFSDSEMEELRNACDVLGQYLKSFD